MEESIEKARESVTEIIHTLTESELLEAIARGAELQKIVQRNLTIRHAVGWTVFLLVVLSHKGAFKLHINIGGKEKATA